jgi:hypothetical protein
MMRSRDASVGAAARPDPSHRATTPRLPDREPGVRPRFTVVELEGPDRVFYRGGPMETFDAAIARTTPTLESLVIADVG